MFSVQYTMTGPNFEWNEELFFNEMMFPLHKRINSRPLSCNSQQYSIIYYQICSEDRFHGKCSYQKKEHKDIFGGNG